MQIRSGGHGDLDFLEARLVEALHGDLRAPRPPFAVFRDEPELRKILAGRGGAGDHPVVAEEKGERLGAGRLRLWTLERHSYGFVAPEVPELGLGVERAHRSRGVGRALLRALVDRARSGGFAGLGLSVSPANRVLERYLCEGFVHVGEPGSSWTLLRNFSSRASPCASGFPRA